jgi:hypothetical protein
MLYGVTTESLPLCSQCGRPAPRVFPREKVGQVCSNCYEAIARRRPEWSAREIVGIATLLLGSALLMIALIALLVR